MMHYKGRIYRILRADEAMRFALEAHIVLCLEDVNDPLERYDLAKESLKTPMLARFMAKHLLPEFKEPIDENNCQEILRAIERFHRDPDHAQVVAENERRKWEAKNGSDG